MGKSRRTLVLILTVGLGFVAVLSVSTVAYFLVRGEQEESVGASDGGKFLPTFAGSDAQKREAALDAIQKFGREHAAYLPVLVETLNEVDASARRRIVAILPALGPMSLDPLTAAVYDRDEAVSRAAISGLTFFGAEAFEVLLEAVHDERENVRSAALEALASLGPEAAPAAPVLLSLLEQTRFANPVHGRSLPPRTGFSRTVSSRTAVTRAIPVGRTSSTRNVVPASTQTSKVSAVRTTASRFRRSTATRRTVRKDLATRITETLAALGPDVIPDVERSLDSGTLEPPTEARLLRLLGGLDSRREATAERFLHRTEGLAAALREEKFDGPAAEQAHYLVESLVGALTQLLGELAIPRLRKLLASEDPLLVMVALSAVRHIVEALAQGGEDLGRFAPLDDEELGPHAVGALLNLGEGTFETAGPIFRWYVEQARKALAVEGVDSREAARNSGLRNILQLAGPALPELIAAASSRDEAEDVRGWALELLVELTNSGSYTAFGNTSSSRTTRGRAMVPYRRSSSRSPSTLLDEHKESIALAIPGILAACVKGPAEQRLLCLRLLRSTWPLVYEVSPEACPALLEWVLVRLGDDSLEVQRKALQQLGALGEKAREAFPDVLELLARETARLGEFGKVRVKEDGAIDWLFSDPPPEDADSARLFEPLRSCCATLLPHAPGVLLVALRESAEGDLRPVLLSLVTADLSLETFQAVFLDLLRDGSLDERRRVTEVLATHGADAAEAAPALIERVQAESRRLRDPDSILGREESLDSIRQSLRAVEAMGTAAIPDLEKLLEDPSSLVRREALRLRLALNPSPEWIRKKLRPLLEDDDTGVRACVRWPLHRAEARARQKPEPPVTPSSKSTTSPSKLQPGAR